MEGKQNNLQLIVKPRKGLSGKLLCHAKNSMPCFVLFSGPHGRSAAVDDYEVVLLVADGFGIAALLPYLKKLAIQPILNHSLDEDNYVKSRLDFWNWNINR